MCHYAGFPYTNFAASPWRMLVNLEEGITAGGSSCSKVLQTCCCQLLHSDALQTLGILQMSDYFSFRLFFICGFFPSSVISLRLIVIKFAGD